MKLWTPPKKLLTRRNFLRGLGAGIAAPAVLRYARGNGLILPQLTGAGSGAGGGGGGYVSGAVHFDGMATSVSVALPFVDGSNTGKFLMSWWMANTIAGADSHHSDILPFCTSPSGLITIGSQGFISDGPQPLIADFYDNSPSFNLQEILSNDNLYPITPWTHYAINVDLEHADPGKIQQLYVGGIPAGFTNDISYAPSLVVSLSQENFIYVGTDGFNYCEYDIAEVQFWAGVGGAAADLSTNIGKFISGGKPVDPSTAAAAFGVQTLLYSGDHTTFPVNQGNGGAATLHGTLTDASTHP